MSVHPEVCSDLLERSGFVAQRPGLVHQKIGRIMQTGPEHLVAIFDWDHTVIDGSTWQIARSCLPEGAQEGLRQFVASNVDKLDSGTMTLDESRAFTTGMLNVLRGPDLPRDTLGRIRRAMGAIPLVDGAWEVFNRCEQSDVETLICSASVADFIGCTAAASGIVPSHIVATPLNTRLGRISGWREGSLTHDLNKHHILRETLTHAIAGRRTNEIVVGDRPHDAMMARSSDALLIRVGGIPANKPGYLAESFAPANHDHQPFDLVATEPGLMAVDGLFACMLGQTRATV